VERQVINAVLGAGGKPIVAPVDRLVRKKLGNDKIDDRSAGMKSIELICLGAALGIALPASGASLTGTVNTAPGTAVNLTNDGSVNWAIWNYSSATDTATVAPSNTKGTPPTSGQAGFISSVTAVTTGNVRGGTVGSATFTYSNGATPVNFPAAATGLIFDATLNTTGEGIRLAVTGSTALTYRVNVWATGFDAIGTMTASLAGFSDVVLSSQTYGTGAKEPTLFSFIFQPTSATDLLNLRYVMTDAGTSNASSHVGIQAVTVSVIPEPSSSMALLGGVGMLACIRRRRVEA
jgi:hypothetical protein